MHEHALAAATFLQEKPPCDNCEFFSRCATQRLACLQFVQYVLAKHFGASCKWRRRAQTQGMQRHPRREIYLRVFDSNDVEEQEVGMKHLNFSVLPETLAAVEEMKQKTGTSIRGLIINALEQAGVAVSEQEKSRRVGRPRKQQTVVPDAAAVEEADHAQSE